MSWRLGNYIIEISNRFEALDNLRDDEDIKRVRENNKEHTKTSAKENLGLHELKQHKQWNNGLMKNVGVFYMKGSRLK